MTDIRTHDLANALLALLHANTVAVNHGALRMVDDKHREPMRAAETQARATLLKHGYRHSLPPDSLETVTSDARRRDLFAAGAPAVPDWFRKAGMPEPAPTLDAVMRQDPRWNDLTKEERGYLTEWARAPHVWKLAVDRGVTEQAVQLGRRSEIIHASKREDHEHAMHRYQMARLTAWRWAFADAMLAQDPQNPGKQPPTARMAGARHQHVEVSDDLASVMAFIFGPLATGPFSSK
ncbi:MAG: hypothetical protein IIZ92_24910 [Aquincola sp.]|nr:hypothetical protein [Aquincola sp.]